MDRFERGIVKLQNILKLAASVIRAATFQKGLDDICHWFLKDAAHL
jgi:hypothetical protein